VAAIGRTERYDRKALAKALVAVAERLESEKAQSACGKAAALLAAALDGAKEATEQSLLAEALGMTATGPPPAEAAGVCGKAPEALLAALEARKERDSLSDWDGSRLLAEGLAAVAARLEPARAADVLVAAFGKTTSEDAWRVLSSALAAMAGRLEPAKA